MKDKYMALLLIVVSSFMLFLSPLGSVSTTLARQERALEQRVDSSDNQVDKPIGGSPCGRSTPGGGVKSEGEETLKRFGQDNVEAYNLASGSVPISVYFHVINEGFKLNKGNVAEFTLDQQINVLNASFASTPFFFVKAGVTRTNNSDWYRMTTDGTISDQERAAKSALHRGGATDLNFYTVNEAPSAWARYACEYTPEPCMDGIVVPHTMLPGGSRTGFNEGDIAVHEVGHWLGLLHTYSPNCANANNEIEECPQRLNPGDGVDDTPAHLQPAGVVGQPCLNPRNSCPEPPGSTPVMDPDDNFMTDTSDSCKQTFTPGQSARMSMQYTRYRQGNSGVSPTASIAWIIPSENTWGPPNTMTVAGYAQNGCGNVQLFWRDTTIGGSWNVVGFQAIPGQDNTWSNTIPSPYKCHIFEAYVNYSGITSPLFTYNGSNAGFCNESVNLIWIQPAESNLRVAGRALNAPPGTQVYVWYRNVTTGAGWVRHYSSAGQLPDGIWWIDVPNTNFYHTYEVQAEYDVVLSSPCTYRGNNTIWWCQ